MASDSLVEIDRFGRGGLHPIGQLVGADARVEFGVLRLVGAEVLIEVGQESSLLALLRVADRVWRAVQMEDRRSLRGTACPGRWPAGTGAPVLRAADDSPSSVSTTNDGRFWFALPRP